ncbi:MAG: energy-coupling factor transporter ATPase [Lachnospiraceae bacterium]|nr:energy-coupling factor transporter ATPase [Lachnospiraceae bacterium]MDY4968863.1 energy-coupling factor transporter ATPase [Lachnospiraceae bacterium]
MSFIKLVKLVHNYITRDEEGEIEDVNHAVDGVDAEINEGEFVAVLGHNGSGKSTLAKHLNALLFPDEGTVWIGGYDTKEEDNLLKVRQTTGMVFQNPDNQIIGSVVEEDVAFGLENIGVETEKIWKRVADSLEAVGMTAYREQSPNRLSGGQKQRVAIAGVMAMRPRCIVLDESTAMLDPVGRREVIETISRLNKEEGITVILITHYMEEAVRADRVLVMHEGHLVMEGTPKDIFSQVDTLKSYHLDVPQVTELAYELNKEGIMLPSDILTVDEMVDTLCQLN